MIDAMVFDALVHPDVTPNEKHNLKIAFDTYDENLINELLLELHMHYGIGSNLLNKYN